jgi:hypothetical protein
MPHDKLDPRTQTDGKSPDAKKSMATAAKVPPSQVDLKVGIEDHHPGEQTVDRDVDAAQGDGSRGRPDENVPPPT